MFVLVILGNFNTTKLTALQEFFALAKLLAIEYALEVRKVNGIIGSAPRVLRKVHRALRHLIVGCEVKVKKAKPRSKGSIVIYYYL